MNKALICSALVALVSLAAWAQAPKKAYMLVQVDVTNPQQYR